MRLIGPNYSSAEALIPYLEQIHATGTEANGGPMRARLEQVIRAQTGAEHVVALANGTVALELALRAVAQEVCPSNASPTVLVPSVTFVASALAIERAGMIPRVCDVDPLALQLTPTSPHHHYDIVMPVCPFGQPLSADWSAFSQRTGVPVVIDAAGAIVEYRIDPDIPAERVVHVWSLHATKPVSAGEGGAIGTSNDSIAATVRSLSQFGPQPQSTNGKISEYSAAVAIASAASLNERLAVLKRIEDVYRSSLPAGLLFGSENYTTGVMNLRLPTAPARDFLADQLRRANVPYKLWYHPYLHANPRFVSSGDRASYPVSEQAMETMIGIPFSPTLSIEDVELVCKLVKSIL
jgi:dTDP-4-amino-4,6-dideoxygalactose transaminase